MSEFDLRFTFPTLCVLAKDVEDDGRAVNYLNLHHVFECASLARRELGIGYDRVSADGFDDVAQVFYFSAPEISSRVGIRSTLQYSIEHLRAGRLTESGKLTQRVLGIFLSALRIDTDQHDLLEPELSVFDLSDVFELRREASDTTKGCAVGQVLLSTVEFFATRSRRIHRRIVQRLGAFSVRKNGDRGRRVWALRSRQNSIDRAGLFVARHYVTG